MKHITQLFICLVWFTGYSQGKQNTKHTPIETIITDLNNDKVQDTLLLYQKPVEGDPGLFTKVNVSLGKHSRHTFQAKDVWDKTDRDFKAKNGNDITSDNVFIYKQANTSFIFLFGFAYGSGREEIAIIRVKDNKAELYFHNTLEEPLHLTDLDNDGRKELICRNLPEIYDIDKTTSAPIGTYSPYLVYKLDNEFVLDKKLTESYNTKHYVWAGIKYNENIKVVYPGEENKRPYIIK